MHRQLNEPYLFITLYSLQVISCCRWLYLWGTECHISDLLGLSHFIHNWLLLAVGTAVLACECDFGVDEGSCDADIQTDEIAPREDVVATDHHA